MSNLADSIDLSTSLKCAALARITPQLLALNLTVMGLLYFSLRNSEMVTIYLVWASVATTVAGIWFVNYLTATHAKKSDDIPDLFNRLKAHAYMCLLMGLCWSILPVLLWESLADASRLSFYILVFTALFGSVILSSPLKGYTHLTAIPGAIGLCIPSLISPNASTLPLIFSVGLLAIIIKTNSNAEDIEATVTGEALKSLKNDTDHFNSPTSNFKYVSDDIDWATDSLGRFSDAHNPQDRMNPRALRFPKTETFKSLFQDSDSVRTLMHHINNQQPFQSIGVCLNQEIAGVRWVSVSGQPIIDQERGFIGYKGKARDITSIKNQESQISRLTHYDTLSGLPNRKYLSAYLNRIKTVVAGEHAPIRALVVLNLDDFKWVNGTLGSDCGDLLLQKVADRLKNIAVSPHFPARLSGDEFAIVLECPSMEDIKRTLTDLQTVFQKPFELGGATAHCTSSMGIRLFPQADQSIEPKTLLRQASLALGAAKDAEKGSWKVFISSMEEKANTRARLEMDLRDALAKNALDIQFQPLIDAKTDEVVSTEVLVRWNHPLRGSISPEDFVSYAEDRGLITELGDWVIRAALRAGSQLPNDVKISVNLSPLQLHAPHLITHIVQSLAHSGVDAHRLELEVTERIFLQNNVFVMRQLSNLQDLGVKISLDDFGTGYSSLAYLQKFPFDKVKIDKSFIDDLAVDKGSRAIVAATLRLAQTLGIRTTAEGIETQYQKDFLTQYGCDELQGYFLGKPMDIANLMQTLGATKSEEAARAKEFTLPRKLKLDWKMRA